MVTLHNRSQTATVIVTYIPDICNPLPSHLRRSQKISSSGKETTLSPNVSLYVHTPLVRRAEQSAVEHRRAPAFRIHAVYSVDCRHLASYPSIQKPEARSQKPEVSSQKPGARSQKPSRYVRIPDPRLQTPDSSVSTT